MSLEQYNPEKEKQFIQTKIFEILEKSGKEGAKPGKPEKFEIQAQIPVEKEKLNWHDNFLSLMEEEFQNKKILDLFCGSNSIKKYFQRKGLKGEVLGVDISSQEADIKTDVAQIDKIIPPEKQFDIVCSFGAVPGVANYETIKNYLKDDGLFISQSSDTIFYEDILPNLEKPKKGTEVEKQLQAFYPVVIVEIKNVKDFLSEKPSNDVYIIWRKK